MKCPTLSICIPTYNRSTHLGECLDAVLSSAKEYKSKIEIVISDNASTDDTQTVVNEYMKMHSIIRYHRNVKNFGAGSNIYIVAEKASGEYVWVLGDDDKISDKAISSILERISLGYNLIITNFSRWSKDFSLMWKQKGISHRQDEEFNDPNKLMKRFGAYLGYISSIIIKKDVLLSTPYTEYKQFIEYELPFLYLVYAGIAIDCHAIFISTPLVHNRSGNSPLSNWFKTFVIGPAMAFKSLQAKGFTPSAVRDANNGVLREFVTPCIISEKSRANASLKRLAGLLAPYYKNSWFFWLICMPVLYVPIPEVFARIAVKIARGIRRR